MKLTKSQHNDRNEVDEGGYALIEQCALNVAGK